MCKHERKGFFFEIFVRKGSHTDTHNNDDDNDADSPTMVPTAPAAAPMTNTCAIVAG